MIEPEPSSLSASHQDHADFSGAKGVLAKFAGSRDGRGILLIREADCRRWLGATGPRGVVTVGRLRGCSGLARERGQLRKINRRNLFCQYGLLWGGQLVPEAQQMLLAIRLEAIEQFVYSGGLHGRLGDYLQEFQFTPGNGSRQRQTQPIVG